MKSVVEMFEEYMVLSYKKDKKLPNNLIDIKIGEYVLARQYRGSLSIIYLLSGTSVQFPVDLYRILKDFAEERGREVLEINSVKKGDKISKFIIYATRLICLLLNKTQLHSDEIVKKICEIGTGDFRQWIKEKFNVELNPIIFRSLSNNLEQL